MLRFLAQNGVSAAFELPHDQLTIQVRRTSQGRDRLNRSTVLVRSILLVLAVAAAGCGAKQSATPAPQAEVAAPARPAIDDSLIGKSIAELQEELTAGKRTSESLTRAYLDRIEAIDRSGPDAAFGACSEPRCHRRREGVGSGTAGKGRAACCMAFLFCSRTTSKPPASWPPRRGRWRCRRTFR